MIYNFQSPLGKELYDDIITNSKSFDKTKIQDPTYSTYLIKKTWDTIGGDIEDKIDENQGYKPGFLKSGYILWNPQSYIEESNVPPPYGENLIDEFSITGENNGAFSKVCKSTNYNYLKSPYIEVRPGEIINGVISFYRALNEDPDPELSENYIYFGIEEYNENKELLSTDYFVINEFSIPEDGIWKTYNNSVILDPEVRYIKAIVKVNSPTSNGLTTYWSGMQLNNLSAISGSSTEYTIIMEDSNLILPDISIPTRVIFPDSGITANRTVTLPTLADNQYKQIRFDNFNTTYALFINGEGAETIETTFTTINLSNEYSILEGTSSTWKRVGYSPIRPKYQIEDRKTAGTLSGTFTSGAWRTRDLTYDNNIKEIIGASLTSNQFNLPAGKYKIYVRTPGWGVNRHRSKLRNITDSTDELWSKGEYNLATSGVSTDAVINDEFTITSEKTFEIQHRCQTTSANHGFGVETNSQFTVDYELYTQVFIEKLI